MSDSENKAAYQQEIVKQCIEMGAFLVTLIAYQCTVDPTFRQVWAARIRKALGIGPKRDTEKEALEQVQKEISLMEHGEFGEVTDAG